jgi:hypothetical protein
MINHFMVMEREATQQTDSIGKKRDGEKLVIISL